MQGTRFALEVQPRIPTKIRALEELAGDLFYSWDQDVRGLFHRLDLDLWTQCSHNPKLFLRRVSQQKLDEAAEDPSFIESYNRALSAYNTYHRGTIQSECEKQLNPQDSLVAYFCAEFGFHESLPIYSGGLGILAGDHCKAASDLAIPFIAVGLLYRQGYFTQTVNAHGQQIAQYHQTNFSDLPITPAFDKEGNEIQVSVQLLGRETHLKVWKARVGRIFVYLLDSDLPENDEYGRSITYQLYGGDRTTRIRQEIVLGIGGVKAIRKLGLNPSVWHINEGHAAFQILERCRECVKLGMDFDSAIELVASGTVFTTHTPVPAGHDFFKHDLIASYFDSYIQELQIPMTRFLELGHSPIAQDSFNMTAFALRGSRFHNGVSEIHGTVASQMESYIWPQVPPEENPISYITNGIHVATFLSREWAALFNMKVGVNWRSELLNEHYWERIDNIANHSFWSVRQSLKSELFGDIKKRIWAQHRRNGTSCAKIERMTALLDTDNANILTIGFARRFATYKRSNLIFRDLQRLTRILNNPERPVMIMFAGKAHPSDEPGQQLIKTIYEFSQRPEFIGKVHLIEGYDMNLARTLVRGVDVWLNTPEYPLEASGTSGEKAGINGVLNLSVLDGWWGEGYNGENGWGITAHGSQYDPYYRDDQESSELLDILEHRIVPLYYENRQQGYSEAWVQKSKNSMKSLIHKFNSQRMVQDYVRQFYGPASRQMKRMSEQDAIAAKQLAIWKRKIVEHWSKVNIERLDVPKSMVQCGDQVSIEVSVQLSELSASDVVVEVVIGREKETGDFVVYEQQQLFPQDKRDDGKTLFKIDLTPNLAGLQYYKIRIYPRHEHLSHPFEMGRMLWV